MQDAARAIALGKIRRSECLTMVLSGLVLAVIVATGIMTEQVLIRQAETRTELTSAVSVDHALKDVMTQMLDIETGQRGFLLSERATYLQPYYVALKQLQKSRAALSDALGPDPTIVAPLAALDNAIAAELEELDQTVKLKSQGNLDEATALLRTDKGKEMMDRVRDAAQVLTTSEEHRVDRSRAEYAMEIRNNYWIFAASFALNLLLVLGLVQRMRYAAAQGTVTRQSMESRIDELSHLLESARARDEQVRGLSQLSRFLQSCKGMDEAVGLLQHQLPLLMRAASGALYLLAPSRDQLRQAFAWGEASYPEHFGTNDCWAVRLGQPFQQPGKSGAAACAHLQFDPSHTHDNVHCLPLVAHGELMGVLVVDAGSASDQRVNLENEGYRRIALEQVGLSIGNLKLRESLHEQSIRDALTGLYNRRFMEESAQRELLRATRLQAEGRTGDMAFLMIDIDHFKRFNDEYGHKVGDLVLREVAEALQRRARGSDVVARYGGEEFMIVLPDMAAALALERAEQVRADVESLTLHALGQALATVTISVGLAEFPGHGSTVEALILASDKALYEAKRAGRNRVVVAT